MNLKYIKCPAFMCFGNLTSPSFLLSGTPILWLRGNGTTCPFGVFPCVEAVFVQFEANPCDEEFRLFMGAAQTHRVLFDTHYGPICTPKTLHFLRKMLNFDANNTTNFGKNKRTNGSIFTHVHPNILIFSSVFVPREPTQPEKSPGLPCVSLEPELRNRLIGICGPPTPQNTQQMLVCN